MKVCTLFGCPNEHKSQGLCGKHYQRLLTTGYLSIRPKKRLFREHCETKAAWVGACYEWVGHRNDLGYGIYNSSYKGKDVSWLTHRLNWKLSGRALVPGEVLDHLCHNPACMNVEHLRSISQADNIFNQRKANKLNKHGVRGVSKHAQSGRWIVQVRGYRGLYASIEEACRVAKETVERIDPIGARGVVTK